MQRFVNKYKNTLLIVNGLFLLMGLVAHVFIKESTISNIMLMVSSLVGLFPIATHALSAAKVKVISIELLVSIAVGGAFIIGNYEESSVVTFLFLFGSYLEQRTLRKTRSAIQSLVNMSPRTATLVLDDEQFETVDIDDVAVKDRVIVRTGDMVPVDGTVIKGMATVNEASITGEATSVKKELESFVYAGTLIENGVLYIQSEKIGEDTTFGKIIELVEEAQDSKSEVERFIDRFAAYYTPFVLMLSLGVFLFSKDVELSVTILVLGCPGALVIGVPVSNVSGIGHGAKVGILLKGSETMNTFRKVDTVVFDKTGTLTKGYPEVVSYHYFGSHKDEDFSYLKSIELESIHPLAHAIVNYLETYDKTDVEKYDVNKGKGIVANINECKILVGNRKLLEEYNVYLNKEHFDVITEYENKGYSIVLYAKDKSLKVIMGIEDQKREGVVKELSRLRNLGIKDIMILSGDNQGAVDNLAAELHVTKAYGNLLPEQKAAHIKKLQDSNKVVAFVGDGINDSPSLAISDIGIAMGNGTDVALETSDIVLMNSEINKLSYALDLSLKTTRNMKQNVFIALAVVIVLIISLMTAEWMTMMLGMLIHEGSILVVILNAMRLLRINDKS